MPLVVVLRITRSVCNMQRDAQHGVDQLTTYLMIWTSGSGPLDLYPGSGGFRVTPKWTPFWTPFGEGIYVLYYVVIPRTPCKGGLPYIYGIYIIMGYT